VLRRFRSLMELFAEEVMPEARRAAAAMDKPALAR
jgi:hypothetical protein